MQTRRWAWYSMFCQKRRSTQRPGSRIRSQKHWRIWRPIWTVQRTCHQKLMRAAAIERKLHANQKCARSLTLFGTLLHRLILQADQVRAFLAG